MEIFRSWGLEDAIRAGSDEVDLALLQTRTLAEAGRGTRVPINVPDVVQSSVVSPTASARVPQDHLERVLAGHLAELPSAAVRRGSEVVGLRQDEHGVRLSVRGLDEEPTEVAAAYVVAADGARSPTRDLLGIRNTGPDGLMRGVSVELRGPLWPVAGPHRYALYSITHPDGEGILIPAGGGRRWQYGVVIGPDVDVEALSRPEVLAERIRAAVGDPDLPVRLVRQSTFSAGATMAEAFSAGRVFLAGDAAHRVTPRGGNGLAMAVRDGIAVGWRLAWVLRGWAPESFLTAYEDELRPLAAQDVARAADPAGRCHAVLTELLHDLGGRVQHVWLTPSGPGQPSVSTLDRIGEGLTVFVAAGAQHWHEATRLVGSPIPVEVVELTAAAGHALGLRQSGAALLVRPDAVPVARFYRTPDSGTARARLEGALTDVLGDTASPEAGAA